MARDSTDPRPGRMRYGRPLRATVGPMAEPEDTKDQKSDAAFGQAALEAFEKALSATLEAASDAQRRAQSMLEDMRKPPRDMQEAAARGRAAVEEIVRIGFEQAERASEAAQSLFAKTMPDS